MRPFIWLRVIGVATILIVLAGCSEARPEERTFIGESTTLGEGEIHTWAQLDAAGNPISIGATFAEGMLSGLPSSGRMIPLLMPEEAHTTLFTHVLFDWNPNGHPPPGIYTRPHFDFHFYMIPDEERAAIRGGFDSVPIEPQFVPPDYSPDGSPQRGIVIRNMGVHWHDAEAPEWNAQDFTKTVIHGFYLGQMIFIEPMITKAYFESKPDVTEEIKLPEAYQRSGYYPTRYRIRYDPDKGEYTVALEGFVSR